MLTDGSRGEGFEARPSCCGIQPQIDVPDVSARAALFKALGEEVRLRVLHLVRDQEVCVCDLMSELKMPQGTLSHHLAVLQQAGLVTSRKHGRWNYYRATDLAKGPLDVFGER